MCCPKCVRLTLPSSFEEDEEKRVDAGFRAEKKSDMIFDLGGRGCDRGSLLLTHPFSSSVGT